MDRTRPRPAQLDAVGWPPAALIRARRRAMAARRMRLLARLLVRGNAGPKPAGRPYARLAGREASLTDRGVGARARRPVAKRCRTGLLPQAAGRYGVDPRRSRTSGPSQQIPRVPARARSFRAGTEWTIRRGRRPLPRSYRPRSRRGVTVPVTAPVLRTTGSVAKRAPAASETRGRKRA